MTVKNDEPRLKLLHEGAARVRHFQPRFIIFDCRTHYCPSSLYWCTPVCLSVYLSICVSVRLLHCMSVCMSVCLLHSMSVCLSVCLSVCYTLCLYVCTLCVCLSVCVCYTLCLYVCLLRCMSVCLLHSMSVCLSVTLCVCMSVCMRSTRCCTWLRRCLHRPFCPVLSWLTVHSLSALINTHCSISTTAMSSLSATAPPRPHPRLLPHAVCRVTRSFIHSFICLFITLCSHLQDCRRLQYARYFVHSFILLFTYMFIHSLPSVLLRCWLGGRKGIRPVKTEWWGAGLVICLERGADLHMAQLMPLPLTVSCFSKIQIDFTILVPAHLGSPR